MAGGMPGDSKVAEDAEGIWSRGAENAARSARAKSKLASASVTRVTLPRGRGGEKPISASHQ